MDKQILNAVKNLEKRVVDLYYKVKNNSTTPGPTGTTGPQGPQGIAGVNGIPGPVGPMGLVWKGAWVSGTSYILNDAVGENGASWFCILATSGTTAPHLDGTHWALLASQGAVGLTGPQGPTGATGAASTLTSGNITATALFPVLTYDLNYVTTAAYNRGVLLPTTTVLGKEVIVYANNLYQDRTIAVKVDLLNSPNISFQGTSSYTSQLDIKANENYKFTHLGNGYWKAEAIGATLAQVTKVGNLIQNGTQTTLLDAGILQIADGYYGVYINPYGLVLNNNTLYGVTIKGPSTCAAPRVITFPDKDGVIALVSVNTTENIASSTGSAPFPYSNSNFAKFTTGSSYALPIATLGDIKYVLTTAAATLWASPNPGNDGANNNFITPDGNGNSYISLLANKSYKFTYIGRYGNTYGYWTAEIMNNI